jgi:hypothetical protein
VESLTFLGVGRKGEVMGFWWGAAFEWMEGRANCDSLAVTAMAKKKKKDRIRVHKEARRLARIGIGMPPTERIILDKRKKAPKHKKKLAAE